MTLLLSIPFAWSLFVCGTLVYGLHDERDSWDKHRWLWWEKAAFPVLVVSLLGMLVS